MGHQIDFYFSPFSGPSRAVWMLLEALGIQYNERVVDLVKGEHKTEEYTKINVRQKVPAVVDGDLAIAESRAVAGYLVSQYGSQSQKDQFYPSEPRKRVKIDQHLYIGEVIFDDIMSYANIGPVLLTPNGKMLSENLGAAKGALDLLEHLLQDHTYSVDNHVTLADFFYLTAVGLLDVTDYNDWEKYPRIVAWKKKMAALPHHKKTHADPIAQLRSVYQAKIKEC